MNALKKLKMVRYFIEYIFVAIFIYSIKILPLKVNYFLAWVAGTFMYYFIPSCRNLVMSNLKVAFPEKSEAERIRIGRAALKNTILIVLEFSWFSGSAKRIKKYVSHPEYHDKTVDELVSQGRGLIYCTGHFGNWDLEGLAIPTHWPQILFAVIARTSPNPFLADILDVARTSTNNVVIPSKGAVKDMKKSLEKGCFLATLIDQNTRVRNGGIFVNFFGLPVPASRAPAMFARKMNIPLTITFCTRKNGFYELTFTELEKKPSEYASDEDLMQALMTKMEEQVRAYPEQYMWMYKRFQNIPREASPELVKKYPYYAKIAEEKFYFKKTEKVD
jgi:KDO2-lipid IV(A) lauroyltransferase